MDTWSLPQLLTFAIQKSMSHAHIRTKNTWTLSNDFKLGFSFWKPMELAEDGKIEDGSAKDCCESLKLHLGLTSD